jgi:hypothetical protein
MKHQFLLSGAALAASFALFAACSSDPTETTPDTDASVTPDAGKDGSTGDSGPTCGAGQLTCGGSCVNAQKDVNNCGACGKACGADEACEAGKCALHCPAGTAVCGTRCVDTATDGTNCGACGKTCAAGSVCSAGKCAVTCAADLTTCTGGAAADAGAPTDGGATDGGAGPTGPYCANAKTDRNNCGGCGVKCGTGEICEGGACKLSCGGGTLQCGNRCVDPSIDANNCGGCGDADATKKCGAGAYCSNASCCTGGKTGCNGACVDQNSDPNNCGGCGVVCDAAKPYCGNGACVALKTYVGIQTNVPVAEVTASGWTQCFVNRMDDFATPVASMTAACAGARIMMACRATGAATLQLMAEAPRADVLFDTATGNVVHNANGTDWYYNTSWSMGFAPAGAGVSRSSCDVASTQADQRLCIHTGGGKFNGGYRCGAATGLNNSAAYERVFFTSP